MLCCALAILVLGPLGFAAASGRRAACCARRYWVAAIAFTALVAAALLAWAILYPVPFRHICSFSGAAVSPF